MKFEPPIAEIEHFQLRDIISASGDMTQPQTTDDPSALDMVFEDNCIYHDKRDNNNWETC